MRKHSRPKSAAKLYPMPLFDWMMRQRLHIHARARALDREADAALFYGRASAAERLSHRAAELREAVR